MYVSLLLALYLLYVRMSNSNQEKKEKCTVLDIINNTKLDHQRKGTKITTHVCMYVVPQKRCLAQYAPMKY